MHFSVLHSEGESTRNEFSAVRGTAGLLSPGYFGVGRRVRRGDTVWLRPPSEHFCNLRIADPFKHVTRIFLSFYFKLTSGSAGHSKLPESAVDNSFSDPSQKPYI